MPSTDARTLLEEDEVNAGDEILTTLQGFLPEEPSCSFQF
jgi:hypothetical protein